MADSDSVDRAADAIVARWGAIDVWVNNAMVSVFAPSWETAAAEYQRVTEVTYLGNVYGTLAALRHMRPRGQGVIVQVGSALAYRSIPLQSAYCAAKSAIRGFTDSLRCELRHERSAVRLTMVQLPAVNTPQFDVMRNKMGKHGMPVPPLFQPEMIAQGIVETARRPTRERWLGAPTVMAILGQRLFPGLLDRYLAHRGWDEQLTDRYPPHSEDNLDAPLPGDRGAAGPFHAEAHPWSLHVWAQNHRREMTAAAAIGCGALAVAGIRNRRLSHAR